MKKKTKNYYFTKKHEEAILDYSSTNDNSIRERLYIDLIQPALNEMVEKIVYTYKFTNLPNIDSHKEDCKIWLTTILDKYDSSKGSTAFSYFSVITKNYFIQKVKKQTKKNKKEVSHNEMPKDLEYKYFTTDENYETDREEDEFWICLISEIDHWDDISIKENEKKVISAIKVIIEHLNELEILNKKAFYLYLRELTGLNTKQIVLNLNKMRDRYKIFKKKWDDGRI